jgi:hypothetical protein
MHLPSHAPERSLNLELGVAILDPFSVASAPYRSALADFTPDRRSVCVLAARIFASTIANQGGVNHERYITNT